VKIPEEIQQEASAAFIAAIIDDDAEPGAGLHAALQIAVDWALEEAAITAIHLNGWSGENAAEHIAKCIRARKDKP
jgi:hypothetical protein